MTAYKFSDTGQPISYHSRRARKGRYALREHDVLHFHGDDVEKVDSGDGTTKLRARVEVTESEFKPHLRADITFWLAVTFVLGSAVWVANGFTVLLPIYLAAISGSDSLTETYFKTAAALAFIGGTLFEIGSYLMIVEAINRAREHNYGKTGRRRRAASATESSSSSTASVNQRENSIKPDFVWWDSPIWSDLGYIAAVIQFFAATVFWVSTITGLPGVIPGYPDSPAVAIVDVFFWTPQVIGGTGFVASSLVLMVEVQKKWWMPNLADLGWHIGFWNLVGSVGFLVCGAMGYSPAERWVDNSAVSTFWGSCAFLIGSLLQLWEAIWREPEAQN